MAVVQILVFAFCALLAHNVHGACRTVAVGSYNVGFASGYGSGCADGQNGCSASVYSSCETALGATPNVSGFFGGYTETQYSCGYSTSCHIDYGCQWGIACYVKVATCYAVVCNQKCEADSLRCKQDTTKVWDSENCTCGPKPPLPQTCNYCEDYVDYSAFPPVAKSKNYECQTCTTDDNGVMQANGCVLQRDSEGSCEDNNDCPSGMICNDSTPNVDCYATVGSKVYLRDRKSGHVWGCDADGDCQTALRKYAQGQCQDPNAPPESSDSQPSSSDSQPSSSEGGGSSASGEGPWALESTLQLNTAYAKKTAENTGDIANYTVTIMGKTSDIYNELVEHGITLNNIKDNSDDIKTNTGATATNTGNIDNKLATTNSLLNDIKNKNWQPHIEVNSPEVTVQGDTNIVNVTADTSHAPSEILSLLRGLFGNADTSSNYNPQDTAGVGDEETGMLDSIRAKVGSDTIPNMTDSLPNAVQGVKTKMRAFRDSVNNSAFGDSVSRWQNQLLNNGVITGNGSNNCPSMFTRTFTWNMGGKLGTWNIGKFQFICEPIQGVGVSLWTLARTLLRAIVAISCMLWLYKTVMGVEGGNDED